MGVTPVDAYERLFELAAVLGDAMERGMAERGLTRARAELLWRLYHRSPMTQRELSEALRCTPRNVTGLLDALQMDGFVTREPHPTDRRATLVDLTDSGRRSLGRLRAEYDRGASELFAGISADDLGVFVTILERLLDRLHVFVETPPVAQHADAPPGA